MKEEVPSLSLEYVGFIFRHPWLFVCPVIILLSLVIAWVSTLPDQYQSSAILSFEVAGSTIIDSKFIQKKGDLVGRTLLGQNIRQIIADVWPQLSEEANPIKYNNLINSLRNPRTGINLQYDKRDQRLLHVTFSSSNPQTCYRVVRATLAILQKENSSAGAKELEKGLAFLKSQLDFYKNKLDSIDVEIAKIKADLKGKFSELSLEEQSLIQDLISRTDRYRSQTVTQPTVDKTAKYDEMLAELNLQLIEAEKKRDNIKRQIETGEYISRSTESTPGQNFNDDPFVKEYSQAIATKQLALAEMISRGYMQQHPDVKRLQSQIDDLMALKEKRLQELKGNLPSPDQETKKINEDAARSELQDIEFQVDTLKDKISLIERYRERTEKGTQEVEVKSSYVAKLVSRLKELQSEMEINQTYYADLRKQLEEAEIKQRLAKEESGFNINIIEEPMVPVSPIPLQKASKLFMGIMFSLGAGLGISYVFDSLNNPIKSSSELRELLRIPVIASIDTIMTPQELKIIRLKRRTIVISLVIFIIVSQIFAKVFLQQP